MKHPNHSMTRPAKRSAAGFTLLELLVSMTIVSLLVTTILFGWRIAAGSWGRVNELVDEQRRIEAVHRVVEEQMADMVPVAPWLRQSNTNVFFQGERRMARFVSRYSLLHRGRSGLYRVEYQIAEADDGSKQLLMNETPMRGVRGIDDTAALLVGMEQSAVGTLLRFTPFQRGEQTRVLLDNLAEAHFEYYRLAGPTEPGGWVTQWASRGDELPRAMALRVETPPAGNTLRPVSVVAAIEHYARNLP